MLKQLCFIVLILVLTGCGASQGNTAEKKQRDVQLIVSAAASLAPSLSEIKSHYEEAYPYVELIFNLAGSGTLQQQIEQGAPVDLFISAGAKQMDALTAKGLTHPNYLTTLLCNELVVIGNTDAALPMEDLADLTNDSVTFIAIGQPETVPAGQYSQESLERNELWMPLQSKFVYAKDVRQVLSLVETHNADAGFVYRTDAMRSEKARILLEVNTRSYSPITYPVAVMKDAKHLSEAIQFYEFLLSEKAQATFESYGFKLTEGA